MIELEKGQIWENKPALLIAGLAVGRIFLLFFQNDDVLDFSCAESRAKCSIRQMFFLFSFYIKINC